MEIVPAGPRSRHPNSTEEPGASLGQGAMKDGPEGEHSRMNHGQTRWRKDPTKPRKMALISEMVAPSWSFVAQEARLETRGQEISH